MMKIANSWPSGIAPAGRAGHEDQHDRIQHDLDADQHHDQVGPPGQQPPHADEEQQPGQDQDMFERDDHFPSPPTPLPEGEGG